MSTISPEEVERRRNALERTLDGGWRPRTLAAAFDEAARRFPDRPYTITDAATLTYADVAERSRRLAAGLIDLGVRPGDRVAMLVDNRVDYPVLKFAVARTGAIAVALNYSYRGDEILQRLAQAEASVVISIDRSAATDFLAVFDERFPGWENGVRSSEVPTLQAHRAGRGRLARGRPHGSRAGGQGRRGDGGCGIGRRLCRRRRRHRVHVGHDRACPGRAAHARHAPAQRLRLGVSPGVRRRVADRLRAAAVPRVRLHRGDGGGPVRRRGDRPAEGVQSAHGAGADRAAPDQRGALRAHDDGRGGRSGGQAAPDLSSLQSVFSAAAPAPVWLWERVLSDLRPQMVFTGYGQTEVSAATALTHPGDPIETVSAVVGAMKRGGSAATDASGLLAEYRTVDPFDAHPLPTGAEGELVVRGPLVTREYVGADAPEALDADGWLRTGDLGFVDEDGYIHLRGRKQGAVQGRRRTGRAERGGAGAQRRRGSEPGVCRRRPGRAPGRDRLGVDRAERGRAAGRASAARARPRAPRAVQGAARDHRHGRRGPADDHDRQDPEVPAGGRPRGMTGRCLRCPLI
ncbi:long-chain fatty acid--CoA ligase [Microbacterium elymi]|uniref:Long-chain fatty acid--CoA ligase n=1 Tax=Microbacterium elymi TaxID=2909587 RepID=A0ABY5NHZ4_9MICO|nr:long-chain fatty acid--CoA ligase [Microbacterium elymi]UUT34749.1 long-chain fatty acid--CoA ligase [Microbacterium elymi]